MNPQSPQSLPPFLRADPKGSAVIFLKVQPRASKNQICDVIGNELKIKIAAPPVDSAANEALVQFLAETLECPRAALRIIRGRTSRHKQIAVAGLDSAAIAQRLLPLASDK